MSDHHDAQDYQANGPANIGFRTTATNINVGGDFTGNSIGVVGTGRTYGVSGTGDQIAGVFGENTGTGAGAIGLGYKGATGLVGASQASASSKSPQKTATNIGVNGVSDGGEGFGVVGRSVGTVKTSGVPGSTDFQGTGTGVLGSTGSGPGVHGISKFGRGGVFEAEFGTAQLRLVPQAVGARLPRAGQPGDLFVRMVQFPPQRDQEKREVAELWFCQEVGTGNRAIWYPIQFGAPQKA